MIKIIFAICLVLLAGEPHLFSNSNKADMLSYLKTLKDGGSKAHDRAVRVGLGSDKMILDECIVSERISTSIIRGNDMPDVIFSTFATETYTIVTKQARSVWYAKIRRNDGARITKNEILSVLRVENGIPLQTLNFYLSDKDNIKILFSMLQEELPSDFSMEAISYSESVKTILARIPTWFSEMQFNERNNEMEMWTLKYTGMPINYTLGYKVGSNMWQIYSP